MLYDELLNIKSINLRDKSVLVIGSGLIAEQYALALKSFGISKVTILSNTKENVAKLCSKFDFTPLSGGFEKNLPNIPKQDLVIIATPISLLLPCLESALESSQTNILVEKPGSLYRKEFQPIIEKYSSAKIRIGYNRLLYPNLLRLKELVQNDGGITSCKFTLTEWTHKINFEKDSSDVYARWGIANTLHVISMVVDLIGMPKEISSYQSGHLDWHPSGSIFVGSGISDSNIPFSYHADWNSNDRWGIEIMTDKNSYRLIPLEDLYVCHKGTINWEKIHTTCAFPGIKPGLAEEIAVMLDDNLSQKIDLPTLSAASKLNQLAETIFGYS
ncbi:MAG: Gfo/Idh/MocA family oxidoreductase [Nitrosarchaeum sp.]|nr:Gfo/Idh/MocA family oxidoreductase [Nitrosarchaeum sp.]